MPRPSTARVLTLCAAGWLAFATPAARASERATEIDGVQMPDTTVVNGVTLRLNGMGVRTFSVLNIRVYVAALYLEHLSHDAEAILASPEIKVIDVVFVHDASVERVREAWENGFRDDCLPPCHLPPDQVATFLSTVPALKKGDTSRILITRDGVDISVNGKSLGVVRDPNFMRTILATYLGPSPPTEGLKRALLGLGR
jgi:hypothetical protein